MASLMIAWLSAAAFAASLAFFLYSYFVRFAVPEYGSAPTGGVLGSVAANGALFTLFALHHSLFARTGVKRIVSRMVSPPLERAVYTLTASVGFALVCWFWLRVPGTAWTVPEAWAPVAYLVIAAGLAVTVAGARVLDVLDLAGVRQVERASALRPRASAASLQTRGVYGFVRHPLYFGWVLLVFGVPDMNLTRFTFAAISTLYLAIAIPFEERSLVETFGPDYASYRKKVRWRMLPGIY